MYTAPFSACSSVGVDSTHRSLDHVGGTPGDLISGCVRCLKSQQNCALQLALLQAHGFSGCQTWQIIWPREEGSSLELHYDVVDDWDYQVLPFRGTSRRFLKFVLVAA